VLPRLTTPKKYLLRSVVSLMGFLVLLGVLMFLPAGDVRWLNGWFMILAFFVLTLPSIAVLWRVNPEIFFARSKIHAGTKGWDKIIAPILMAAVFSVFPVAALDAGRFHWSAVPPWLIGVGYVLLTVGWVGSIWVYSVNKFAEVTVRIQADRGQTVISFSTATNSRASGRRARGSCSGRSRGVCRARARAVANGGLR
jgi:hypothetical protein